MQVFEKRIFHLCLVMGLLITNHVVKALKLAGDNKNNEDLPDVSMMKWGIASATLITCSIQIPTTQSDPSDFLLHLLCPLMNSASTTSQSCYINCKRQCVSDKCTELHFNQVFQNCSRVRASPYRIDYHFMLNPHFNPVAGNWQCQYRGILSKPIYLPHIFRLNKTSTTTTTATSATTSTFHSSKRKLEPTKVENTNSKMSTKKSDGSSLDPGIKYMMIIGIALLLSAVMNITFVVMLCLYKCRYNSIQKQYDGVHSLYHSSNQHQQKRYNYPNSNSNTPRTNGYHGDIVGHPSSFMETDSMMTKSSSVRNHSSNGYGGNNYDSQSANGATNYQARGSPLPTAGLVPIATTAHAAGSHPIRSRTSSVASISVSGGAPSGNGPVILHAGPIGTSMVLHDSHGQRYQCMAMQLVPVPTGAPGSVAASVPAVTTANGTTSLSSTSGGATASLCEDLGSPSTQHDLGPMMHQFYSCNNNNINHIQNQSQLRYPIAGSTELPSVSPPSSAGHAAMLHYQSPPQYCSQPIFCNDSNDESGIASDYNSVPTGPQRMMMMAQDRIDLISDCTKPQLSMTANTDSQFLDN